MIGKTLGPYEITGPLGAGGMGEVFRAKDTRLDRDVAVKVLPKHLSSHPEVRARFEREAKTVSSLNHPHICTLHDVGREGDIDYLVMELVDGETLAQRLEKGALPADELLRLGVQICDALEQAHRAGVIHRDLKPGNVMLTKSGAKLMDFGLARVKLQLSWMVEGGSQAGLPKPVAPRRKKRDRLAWGVAAAAIVAAAALAFLLLRPRPELPAVHAFLQPPEGVLYFSAFELSDIAP